MPRSLYLASAFVLLSGFARATHWTDPSFEDMVTGADLIAVVEIVEGGQFECSAKAIDVLKGRDPGTPFVLCGFNNPNWPKEGIEEESMRKGARLLAFLSKETLNPEADASAGSHACGDGLGEASPDGSGKVKGKGDATSKDKASGSDKDQRETQAKASKARTRTVWRVPTPTSGDLPIIDGRIHGGWYRTTYPDAQGGTDVEMVLALIRGYLLHLEGKPPTAARKIIAERLTSDAVGAVTDAEDAENVARMKAVEWLLCAQAVYGEEAAAPAVLAATAKDIDLVKICGARALRSLGRSRGVLDRIAALLKVEHSFVQAEAAKSLLALGYPAGEAVPVLVAALPTSESFEDGRERIMSPLRNTYASGRETMVHALTELGAAKEAHEALLGLIQEEGLTEGVFHALARHFLKYPSARARAKFIEMYVRCPEEAVPIFNSYLLEERSPESLAAVADRILKDKGGWCRQESLEGLAKAVPQGDPLLSRVVLAVLRERDTTLCFPFAVKAATEEIRRELDLYPSDGLDASERDLLSLVREAVALKLSPERKAEAYVDAWVRLVRKGEAIGRVSEHLLGELVRSTTAEFRSYAVQKLREGQDPDGLSLDTLAAIQALGGKLSEAEERELKDAPPGLIVTFDR
ncbi:MAG TPA: HEAT repeat domain-containing protein [Planctomycetota bacterium]|jgi:hypothetical protein|nr:hypothetical protein [Planctomycetota bacterium]OQC19431.1 MAG: hypothetical protein BWX69_02711 [Planctomycetes bacterium ADurb.Bin069]NMD36994.1 hypothetical protein [Planctomycetota bacterium]HNS00482.1 HEAT repeat domain-containing protein [Planctomycetota bacterium]HNU27185.1 HEAT repeat domain-containing protein [Planctomycetota bacterium]